MRSARLAAMFSSWYGICTFDHSSAREIEIKERSGWSHFAMGRRKVPPPTHNRGGLELPAGWDITTWLRRSGANSAIVENWKIEAIGNLTPKVRSTLASNLVARRECPPSSKKSWSVP